MSKSEKLVKFVTLLIIIFSFSLTFIFAQKKSKVVLPKGKPVMWDKVNIGQRNLFYGPGGKEMQPDLSKITFIKEEKGGHNKKYRIKDGSGMVWVAKPGREAGDATPWCIRDGG